jgi:hypothetical protein
VAEQEVIDELAGVQNIDDRKTARMKMREVREGIARKFLIAKVEFDGPIRSTPTVANGVLYVNTQKTLYAIGRR